jgi:uncharacterized membrane protein
MNMRLLAIISAILTVLVGADAIYMIVTHYKPSDSNNFNLSDGGTVVIAAVLLLILTIVAFVMASRQAHKVEPTPATDDADANRARDAQTGLNS